MPRMIAIQPIGDTYKMCDWCEPDNDMPIRYLAMADDDPDSMRLCFRHAARLRNSSDPREKLWARLTLDPDAS